MNTHKQNENQESDQIKWLVENCVRADTIHQTRESASMCVYLSIGLRRGSNCSLLLTINRYRHHYDSTIAVARHWIRYDAPTHIFIPHTCSNPYTHRIRSEKLCHRRQTVCIFLFGHLSYFYIMCTINNTTYAWKVEEIRGGERKPEQKISATFFIPMYSKLHAISFCLPRLHTLSTKSRILIELIWFDSLFLSIQ